MENIIEISIDGVVSTSLSQEQWETDFLEWLESREESFGGGINNLPNENERLQQREDDDNYQLSIHSKF